MKESSDADAVGDAFARHRRFLFGLCYRMTGSGADAEDLVQETFERALRHAPADTDRDLKPWLARVAVNACRDHLRRRKVRGYDGTWLPGPIETPPGDPYWQGVESAEARYGRLESVSFAFLRAMEALTPSQRAVLLLRDVFDLSVRETAEALEMGEANVKTTLHRARRALEGFDMARPVTTAEQRRRAEQALLAFLTHLANRDEAALRALLTEDVVMLNDANGESFAARKPVVGIERVLTFIRKTAREPEGRMAIATLNGTPAWLADVPPERDGVAQRFVMWVELAPDGRIAQIAAVMASRKLAALDFDALEPFGE